MIHFQKLSHVDNINLIGKTAIQVLLSPEGANYKRQLVDYLRLNTSLVYKKLLINNKLKPMESDATFLVWCDFRNYGSWQEVSKILINDLLLEDAVVLLEELNDVAVFSENKSYSLFNLMRVYYQLNEFLKHLFLVTVK